MIAKSTAANAQKKTPRIANRLQPKSFVESRSTSSMWIAFIQRLIPKIMELIRTESPEASLKIPKTARCPSAKQINESRKSIEGFGNLAIPLIIKYQDTLNVFVDKLNDASKTRLTMKGFFPNPNVIPDDMLESIKMIITKILSQEDQLNKVEDLLEKLPKEIDNLIENFINQWQKHEQTFAEMMIQEIEAELGPLSDPEKMAILNKTKTISEIRNELKRADINLNDTKSFGTLNNFKLRAMAAIVSKLSIQLKQNAITTANIAKIISGMKSIKAEADASSTISKTQKTEYKNFDTKIKECRNSMSKLTLEKDRQTLVTLYHSHQASLKKAATEAAAQKALKTLEYDD